MTDVRKLVERLSAAERAQRARPILAPCIAGGLLRVRIAGLVQTFTPLPRDYSGWGIFSLHDEGVARWLEHADLPQIARYLERLPQVRFRLAYRMSGLTWLAYPFSEGDFSARFGPPRPVPLHLVAEAGRFDAVLARADGGVFWFEGVDRNADAQVTAALESALAGQTAPDDVQFSGLTPEMRTTYRLVAEQLEEFTTLQEERRLRGALALGGATLESWQESGDHWLVTWSSADGEKHVSAIKPDDLTVVSAGICLSGLDASFDLQSLPGVVEGA